MRGARLWGVWRGAEVRRWAAILLILASCSQTPTPLPSPSPITTPTPVTSPTPVPTPSTCPPLSRWTSGIHNIVGPDNRVAEKPVSGGHVVVDSTPLFNGGACNSEHDSCGGRKCEDPRGGVWESSGPSRVEVRGGGYQLRFGPLAPGRHIWKVCPRHDLLDREGQPVMILNDPCTSGEFIVEGD